MRCSLPVLYNLSIWKLISQRLSNLYSRIIIDFIPPTLTCRSNLMVVGLEEQLDTYHMMLFFI